MRSRNPFPSDVHHREAVLNILGSEELVSQFDWDLVKMYLQKFSFTNASSDTDTAAAKDDPTGRRLVLDLLAKDPPHDIVDEALCAFPDALLQNVSAFFVASRLQNSQPLCQLLRHVLLGRQNGEEQPLGCPYPWIQMSHISVEAARVLLNYCPEGINGTLLNSDATLLDTMLFSSEKCSELYYPKYQNRSSWWEKLNLMLQVAEHGTLCDFRAHHPIHTILRTVLARSELMGNCRTARHIVWLLHQMRLRDRSPFRLKDENGDLPLHIALQHECACASGPAYELIGLLIEAHPPSARASTGNHRLPLHVALENGWPGYERLLAMAPESLHTRDVTTGLVPFQIAAVRQTWSHRQPEMEVRSIDTIYTLLRSDPVQVRGMSRWGR